MMYPKCTLGLLVLLSVGCNGGADDETVSTTTTTTTTTTATTSTVNSDADGDGYIGTAFGGDDCDDDDASLTPADDDGDGYSSCDGDCNDNDNSIHPGGDDGLLRDGDCDGNVLKDRSLAFSDYSFTGDTIGDYVGYAVSSAGDVDGDGLDDILVSAPKNDGWEGVHLILGASLGDEATIDLANADYSFARENEGDWAGCSVSSAGDVDADGLGDILIGAYGNDDAGTSAGKAYLILGASLGGNAAIDLTNADYQFIGENSEDYAGYTVANAGDVDSDGRDDILVGAYMNDDGGDRSGKAYLILAASLGGDPTIDLAEADYTFVGEHEGDFLSGGAGVAGAGDVDGDGRDDILIGAFYNDDAGKNAGMGYLILGASLGGDSAFDVANADYRFLGEHKADAAGYALSSAGDVDGDGRDDILLGVYLNDDGGDGAGKAYLFLGASLGGDTTIDLADADYSFVGEAEGDYAGISVSSAGDVDGDGLDDILIGAFINDDGGKDSGEGKECYCFLPLTYQPGHVGLVSRIFLQSIGNITVCIVTIARYLQGSSEKVSMPSQGYFSA